ncbi:hypothetical protein NCLIV_008580 [Neospora caninum Liverpool]|uniref:Uncharacterized protein n=1 Tax=Neospora caninum (strain Liverpool) TaxID=572307 RepID=F0V9G4_NEOCL|nr:hypothetical protein NCLIV_008580 [Neospora caninum Liverpool]CBZ50389.1 hypothetical protein NCLIV_008580 [Neospora caninum Liverpool]CEL64997.1 TPA: hypothetical protein BN1204_008580 [Neospora caninum Liverpool]|eukprot:XP_003880423.1 hypothetical protein NCLIV_008580 [Neospora caninum Liverpool]
MRYNLRSKTRRQAPQAPSPLPKNSMRPSEKGPGGTLSQRGGSRSDSVFSGEREIPESPTRQEPDCVVEGGFAPLPERQSAFACAPAHVAFPVAVRPHQEQPETEQASITDPSEDDGPTNQSAVSQNRSLPVFRSQQSHVQEINGGASEILSESPKGLHNAGGMLQTKERNCATKSSADSHSSQLTTIAAENDRPATERTAERAKTGTSTESTSGGEQFSFRAARRLRPRLLLPSPASTPSLTQCRKKRRILLHSEHSGLDSDVAGTALSNPSVSFVCSSSIRTTSTTSPASSGPRSYPSSCEANGGPSTSRAADPTQRSRIPAVVQCHRFQQDMHGSPEGGESPCSAAFVASTRCPNARAEQWQRSDAADSALESNGSVKGLPLLSDPSLGTIEPFQPVQENQAPTSAGCSQPPQAGSLTGVNVTSSNPPQPLPATLPCANPSGFVSADSSRSDCTSREAVTSSTPTPDPRCVDASRNAMAERSLHLELSGRASTFSQPTSGTSGSLGAGTASGCSEGSHALASVALCRVVAPVTVVGAHISSLDAETDELEGQSRGAVPHAAVRSSERLWELSAQGSAVTSTPSGSCRIRKHREAPSVPLRQKGRREEKRETRLYIHQSAASCRPTASPSLHSDTSSRSPAPYCCSSSLLLSHLPPAILCAVLRCLPFPSVVAFGATCRYARELTHLPAAWNLLEDAAVQKLLQHQKASSASGKRSSGRVRPRLRDFKTLISRFNGVTKLAVDLTVNSAPTSAYTFPWHSSPHTSATAVLPPALLRLLPTRISSHASDNGSAARGRARAATGLIRSADSTTATNVSSIPVTSGPSRRGDGEPVLFLQGFVGERDIPGMVRPSLAAEGHRARPWQDAGHPSHPSQQNSGSGGEAALSRGTVRVSGDREPRARSVSVSDQDHQDPPEGLVTCEAPEVLSKGPPPCPSRDLGTGSIEQRLPESHGHGSEPQPMVHQLPALTAGAEPRERGSLSSVCHDMRDGGATATPGTPPLAWRPIDRREMPVTSNFISRPATSVSRGERCESPVAGAAVDNSQETVEPQRPVDLAGARLGMMPLEAANQAPVVEQRLSQSGRERGSADAPLNGDSLGSHESPMETLGRFSEESAGRDDRRQCEDFSRERQRREREAEPSGESTEPSASQQVSRDPLLLLFPSASPQGTSAGPQERERGDGCARGEGDPLRSPLQPSSGDSISRGLLSRRQDGATPAACTGERFQHRSHHHRVRMERQQLMLLHQLLVHLQGQQTNRSPSQPSASPRGRQTASEHPQEHPQAHPCTRDARMHPRTHLPTMRNRTASPSVNRSWGTHLFQGEPANESSAPREQVTDEQTRVHEARDRGPPLEGGYAYEGLEPQDLRASETSRVDGCMQLVAPVQDLEGVDNGCGPNPLRNSRQLSHQEGSPSVPSGRTANDNNGDSLPLQSSVHPYAQRAEEAAFQNSTQLSRTEMPRRGASMAILAGVERWPDAQNLADAEATPPEPIRFQRPVQSHRGENMEQQVLLLPFLFASGTQFPFAFARQGDQLAVLVSSPGSACLARNARRQQRQQAAQVSTRTRRRGNARMLLGPSRRGPRGQSRRSASGGGLVSPAALRALFGGLRHLVQLTLKLEAKEVKRLHQLSLELDLVQGLLQQNAKTLRVFKLSVELPHEREVRVDISPTETGCCECSTCYQAAICELTSSRECAVVFQLTGEGELAATRHRSGLRGRRAYNKGTLQPLNLPRQLPVLQVFHTNFPIHVPPGFSAGPSFTHLCIRCLHRFVAPYFSRVEGRNSRARDYRNSSDRRTAVEPSPDSSTACQCGRAVSRPSCHCGKRRQSRGQGGFDGPLAGGRGTRQQRPGASGKRNQRGGLTGGEGRSQLPPSRKRLREETGPDSMDETQRDKLEEASAENLRGKGGAESPRAALDWGLSPSHTLSPQSDIGTLSLQNSPASNARAEISEHIRNLFPPAPVPGEMEPPPGTGGGTSDCGGSGAVSAAQLRHPTHSDDASLNKTRGFLRSPSSPCSWKKMSEGKCSFPVGDGAQKDFEQAEDRRICEARPPEADTWERTAKAETCVRRRKGIRSFCRRELPCRSSGYQPRRASAFSSAKEDSSKPLSQLQRLLHAGRETLQQVDLQGDPPRTFCCLHPQLKFNK